MYFNQFKKPIALKNLAHYLKPIHISEHCQLTQEISGVNTLAYAQPDQLTFIAEAKYAPLATGCKAYVFVIDQKTHNTQILTPMQRCIVVENVWGAMANLLNNFYEQGENRAVGIHPTTVIGEGCTIAPDVQIAAHVSIGDHVTIGSKVTIGANSTIESNVWVGSDTDIESQVVLKKDTFIGSRVRISPGVVIGSAGFKYQDIDGVLVRIPQVGRVVIEDDVEIGANTTIDRSFLNETRIGKGTKIDNQVHIAHNCQIGAHCMIAGRVAISGSVTIGDHCILWGGAGFVDNITLGAYSTVYAGAELSKSFPAHSKLWGAPAREMKEAKKILFYTHKIPELFKIVKDIQKQLKG
ncbi:MAG TPA: UDP-3-O-(3-hydroxymyristoyl)glucosamine N-acyltransferase [Legionella sp.]|nr:UDP-3-O-(3-hydroxymyristoyl)glucosamine N-acyltransferase [Legionella sp.]